MDDFTQLRRRIEDLRHQVDQFRSNTQDDDTYIGRVFDAGAIPTTTPRMFATHPLDIVFSESEGATPTKTPDTTTTEYVLVLGESAPAVDDELIAKRVNGLWMANVPSSSIVCTPCNIPKGKTFTLTLNYFTDSAHTTTNTTSCTLTYSGGLYKNPGTEGTTSGLFTADYDNGILGPLPTYHIFELECSGIIAVISGVTTVIGPRVMLFHVYYTPSLNHTTRMVYVPGYFSGASMTCNPFTISASVIPNVTVYADNGLGNYFAANLADNTLSLS